MYNNNLMSSNGRRKHLVFCIILAISVLSMLMGFEFLIPSSMVAYACLIILLATGNSRFSPRHFMLSIKMMIDDFHPGQLSFRPTTVNDDKSAQLLPSPGQGSFTKVYNDTAAVANVIELSAESSTMCVPETGSVSTQGNLIENEYQGTDMNHTMSNIKIAAADFHSGQTTAQSSCVKPYNDATMVVISAESSPMCVSESSKRGNDIISNIKIAAADIHLGQTTAQSLCVKPYNDATVVVISAESSAMCVPETGSVSTQGNLIENEYQGTDMNHTMSNIKIAAADFHSGQTTAQSSCVRPYNDATVVVISAESSPMCVPESSKRGNVIMSNIKIVAADFHSGQSTGQLSFGTVDKALSSSLCALSLPSRGNQKVNFKVKSLIAAKAAKEKEEQREKERKIKKKTFESELRIIKQENMKKMKLHLMMKEEEVRRKEAKIAAARLRRLKELEKIKHKPVKLRKETGLHLKISPLKLFTEEDQHAMSPYHDEYPPASGWRAFKYRVAKVLPLQEKMNPDSIFFIDSSF